MNMNHQQVTSSDQPDLFISTQEVRRVINEIMARSKAELRRFQDQIEAHKDDDPVVIAQLHIRVVECSTAWNTAFLLANELHVKLGDKREVQ